MEMGTEKRSTVSNGEWKIMDLLWKEEPRTLMELVRELEQETGWSKSTVATMLGRMEKKGLLRREEGERAKRYYPLVKQEETALRETRSLLEKAYSGSVGLLVNALVKQDGLSREDREALRRILREAEEREES